MAEFIESYNNDSSVGLLATPINTSVAARTFLKNLPLYREGLSPLLRGLEVGMAHGYFVMGPFLKLGPLRGTEYATYIAYACTIAIIGVLLLAMFLYVSIAYQDESKFAKNPRLIDSMIFSSEQWSQFISGVGVGGLGGATVVFLIYSL